MRSKTIRRFIGTGPIANLMLVFVVLAIVGEYMHLGPIFVFTFAALSCIPLSYRLGQSTEVLGSRLGPVSGGLLNATFGNAAELIISIIALNHGLFIVVRTTLVGSIVGQLLLVLGTSLLLAGLKHRNLGFNRDLVQANFTLMAIAFIAIGLPSVLMITAPETSLSKISFLSPTLAAILLVIYAFAVMFSLRRQPVESDDGDTPGWRLKTAVIVLAGSTGGIIFVSEFLVTSIMPFIEETGVSQVFIGIILIPIFSNVVDHIVAITVAMKNKMDLSLTVSVGSAAQVACMVLPIIVLIASAMGETTAFIFAPVELIVLGAGLALMIPVLLDGASNWLEGAELLTGYAILAVVLWAV